MASLRFSSQSPDVSRQSEQRRENYTTPDDIKALILLTLAHRLLLNPESHLRGRTAAALLADLLATTPLELEREPRG